MSRKRAGDADISSEVVWLLAAFWDVSLASVGGRHGCLSSSGVAVGCVLGRVVGECGCGRHGCLSSSGDLKVVASWQQDPQGAA